MTLEDKRDWIFKANLEVQMMEHAFKYIRDGNSQIPVNTFPLLEFAVNMALLGFIAV